MSSLAHRKPRISMQGETAGCMEVSCDYPSGGLHFMLSLEFLQFADKLRRNPYDNPRRIGYAALRQIQENRILSEDCGCPNMTQTMTHIGGIKAEWLTPPGAPKEKAVIYVHGGGWSLGGIRQTRLFLAPMVQQFQIATLHFDYRLMPENPFPAGLDDCFSLYRGLLKEGWQAENLLLAGESAGANLALALLLRLKEAQLPLPAAVALMSPITFMDTMEGSHRELADLDLILAEDSFILCDVARLYAPGWDKRHPWLSPLYGDLEGLPPMQLFAGTDELLFDDTIRFYHKSRLAGNQVELIIGDHMLHSWPIFMRDFPEAESAVRTMAAFIRSHLLHDGQDQEPRYEDRLVKAALEEIEQNYAQANLSKLAAIYNQTLYGYSKLIKKQTGYNFKELLKNKRLSVVERQLTATEKSIKSIALEAGYENMTHFYELFSEKYGKTPQKYRADFRTKQNFAKSDSKTSK